MPGKFHGQRSLAGYSPWVAKSQTRQCAQMHVLCCSVAKKARHARNEAAGRSDTRSSPGPGLSVPCVDSCSGIGLPVPCTRAGESVCSLAGRAPATLASDLPEHVSPSPTLGLHPCQSLPGWLLLGLRSWLECHHEAALSRKCCPVILCNENSL